jgi:hypothetical protein
MSTDSTKEVQMRKTFALMFSPVLLVSIAILATPATAGTKVLSGTYSKDQVLTDCQNAGGVPFSGGAGGAFGCNASGGSVVCSKAGKCTGTCSNCQQQRVSGGIKGILQPPKSAGAAQPPGSSGGKGTTKIGVTPPASAGAKQEPSGGSTGHPVIEKQSGSGGKH